MNKELDKMKYFFASEKVEYFIFISENLLQYVNENEILPDENVRSDMKIIINKLEDWLK